ncbi:MAG: DNA polymerase III subunit alpha [Bacteroidales bacterium]|nr:DNA polymerase III subunit alpha [Bacteroidales bacterium]MBN2818533.1 DNA polymerase III subunit alpha [Bacteroidales bacterium]
MFLIFDTETTGLPKNYKAPLTDFNNWPRMVQIAWQIHDEKGGLLEVQNYIVKPEGFEIPFQAEKVHGISTERALRDGHDLTWVLEEFNKAIEKSAFVVGHNIEFDVNIIGCEYLRKSVPTKLHNKKLVDTKDESTDYCALPGGRGGKYKWPTLSELHNKLFGEGFDEAHNASADVVATSRCFLELVRQGVISSQRLNQAPDFYPGFCKANPDVIAPIEIEIDSNFEVSSAATEEISVEEELARIEEQAVEVSGEKDFVHLHVHSQYSILDGAAAISALVDKAVHCGMKALALTDHGNMFGIKEFHEACKRAQIKPILGCEAYIVDDLTKKDKSNYHIILLAKNETGYKNLLKLISIANIRGMYYKPRIDKEVLRKHSEGLIMSSACLGGEIPRTLMNQGIEAAEKVLLEYKEIFGDDMYLEVSRHPTEDPRLKTEVFENQLYVNEELKKLAQKHNLKVIATNDIHFINEDDATAHDLLICLNTGKDVDDPSRMRYTRQEWFKTPDEMYALFADNPQALKNTVELAEKIEEFELDSNPIMPEFPIPEDFGTIDLYKEKYSEEDLKTEFERYDQLGGYDSVIRIKLESDYLDHLTYLGARKRYGEAFSGDNKERIDFELNTIKQMGFPGYFLIVQDFITAARNMGVLVGPGRGSAAGAAVSYSLGITNIDPIQHDLLFERFLNPDRISMPDIDIDFDDDGRQMVLDWVTDKYGHDRVAHICTFGTMAAKMAMKDVARVLRLPLDEANRLTKEFPENGKLSRAYQIITSLEKETGSLEKAIDKIRHERSIANKQDNSKEVIIRDVQLFIADEISKARSTNNKTELDTLSNACILEGSVRQTGVHACGILIGKTALDNYIPLMPTKDEDLLTTQYDGRYVESIGLLKMDFLGLKTLSIIKEALSNIKLSRNLDIDIDKIPFEDSTTFDLFSNGETTAIFQFESPGMKKHLRALKPNRFEDLVAMNALYRPGPMEYIPDFIDRKHGRKVVAYDHPLMKQYLEDTYGITVFQEQVMLLSRELGGFTRGQSDTLRKAMGKKKLKMMEELKVLFVEGCLNNEKFTEGCKQEKKDPHELIEKIWKDWVAFASYAFNKSHSVCYAYVAYQTGYLKAHFPAEFMAATLSRNLSNITEVTKLMEEARRMGLRVLVPDVNESRATFTVNRSGNIRFGMAAIKGVGEAAVQHIIEEREKNGSFIDIYDFIKRVNLSTVNKKCIENMVMAGCFDSFPEIARHQFFFCDAEGLSFIDLLVRYGNLVRNQTGAQTLFGNDSSYMETQKQPDIPVCEEWPPLEKLNKEKELIGIYLSSHPLDDYKLEIKSFAKNKLADLVNLESLNNKQVSVVGLVTEVKHLMTKTGKPYGALTIEDYSDSYRFMLFGKDYEEFRNYLFEGYSLFIKGVVQENQWKKEVRELEFKVKSIVLLANVRDELVKSISLKMPLQDLSDDLVDKIHEEVDKSKGKANLSFQIYDEKEGMGIEMFSRNTMVQVSNELMNFLEENNIEYAVN